MLTVISPSKNLVEGAVASPEGVTLPELLADTGMLADILQQFSELEIAQLMGISARLARLNHERFARWHTPFTTQNAQPAIFVFKGDVYTGLAADTLTPEAVEFAQERLRILSGFYGLLRPLDLMQPYRLEMATRLTTQRGVNLYQFWKSKITEALNRCLAEIPSRVLVNLASVAYFKAVDPRRLEGEVITPVFKDKRNGQYKVIGFFAKQARGLMARYIIDNRLSDPGDLQNFAAEGYRFNPTLSQDHTYVFTRDAR